MQMKSEPPLNLEHLDTSENLSHGEDDILTEQFDSIGKEYEDQESSSETIEHQQFENENEASIELQMELTTEEPNIFDGLDVKLEPINSENDRRNRKRKFMDEDSEREICGKIMLTTSLHHHMQNIHNTSSNDEECECEPCRKKFRTADILLKYMQIKHDRVEHQTERRQRRIIRDAKTVRAKKFQRKSGKMKHIEKNIHLNQINKTQTNLF